MEIKTNKEENKEEIKGDDTMAADVMSRNFVYQMKVDKNSKRKEPTVGKDIIEEAKKVLSKYKVR